MALTRFLRQAQVKLDGLTTDREIFTGLSPSTLKVWSFQRIELAPLATGGIDRPGLGVDEIRSFVFRLAEEPGTYGAAQGLENPKVLFHCSEVHQYEMTVTATSDMGGGGKYPIVWEAPKGLITHASTLYATADSTYPAFGNWAMRIYYTLIDIDQDDLVFLKSVR